MNLEESCKNICEDLPRGYKELCEQYYIKKYSNEEARKLAKQADTLEGIFPTIPHQTMGKYGQEFFLSIAKLGLTNAQMEKKKGEPSEQKVDITSEYMNIEVKLTTEASGVINQLRCYSDNIYYAVINYCTQDIYFGPSNELYTIGRFQHSPTILMTGWKNIVEHYSHHIYSITPVGISAIISIMRNYEKTYATN